MVTVQLALISSCAIGLPTIVERPITTASRPASLPSRAFSMIRQPSGVHGTNAFSSCPVASSPTLTG